MRPFPCRFTIRTMMIVVLISAVILTMWILVPRAVDPLLSDRGGTCPAVWIGGTGTVRYIVLVIMLTGIVALPFGLAMVLALGRVPKDRVGHRLIVRWLMAVLPWLSAWQSCAIH